MQLSIQILVGLRLPLRRKGIKCLKNLFSRYANGFEGALICEKNGGHIEYIYRFVSIFFFFVHFFNPQTTYFHISIFTSSSSSCRAIRYFWLSFATPPYCPLLPAGPHGNIPYWHWVAICRFELDFHYLYQLYDHLIKHSRTTNKICLWSCNHGHTNSSR